MQLNFKLHLDALPDSADHETMCPSPRFEFERGSHSSIARLSLLSVIETYTRYYASGKDHTSRAKRLDLDHFTAFLARHRGYAKAEKLKVQDWDHSAMQRFIDEALRKGEAPATVARRLATLKHMGRTLSEKVAGFINPARDVKAPKHQPLKPKALAAAEIRKVLATASARLGEKDSFIRARNLMIFQFMLDTGLRAEEVRLLRLSQLDEKLEWIENVRTKGRRYRNVYITSASRSTLRKYLELREKELKRFYSKLSSTQNKELPLFISCYGAVPGNPDSFIMGAKTLWRAVNELSSGTKLHPHLLRHSYAMDLLDTSNDVRLVSQALGHSDVRVTMRYTERRDEDVALALEKSRKKNK